MNEVVHGEEEPKRALSKENIMRQYYKIQPNPFHFALGCEDSSDNKEHWIKTDADCKHIITNIINFNILKAPNLLCIYIYHD